MPYICGPVLHMLIRASTEPYDEARLRTQLLTKIFTIGLLLPREPVLSPRLKQLVPEHSDRLKIHDAEHVVDALEAVVENPDQELRAELLALRLIVARLGGVHSAMRIGNVIFEELRTRTKARGRPLV